MKYLRRAVEDLLNSATMYRVTVYALGGVIAAAFLLALTGHVSYTPSAMLLALAILLTVSYVTSRLFAYTFSLQHNPDSWLITALILFCIISPPSTALAAVRLGMIALLATASKYLLAFRGRHVFNPAAVAVAISGFVGLGYASWWIDSPPLLPVLFVTGGLLVWKTRRFAMVGTFLLVGLSTVALLAITNSHPVLHSLRAAINSYPLLFLACFMLTEPLTSPTMRRWQLIYAVTVGVLAHAQLFSWLSAEIALVLGNTIAFATSPRRRLSFELQSVSKLAERTYEITLRSEQQLSWQPGQYIDLALPHKRHDAHGSRRTFSIASTPAEGVVRLGITHGQDISSFKRALLFAPPGTELTATSVGGDFVLDSSDRPLVFLAGGIGITPFRAMVQQLLETGSQRPVSLLYFGRTLESLGWSSFFAQATLQLPLQFVPIVSQPSAAWQGETGRINLELLQRLLPTITDSTVYASGPPVFVETAQTLLLRAGVPRIHIKTDYFSGY